MVNNFTYLDSVVFCDSEILEDIKCKLAKASQAFGYLRCSIFANYNGPLSVETE